MGKNEHYGLAEEYKVKVTLSPPSRLLPLSSFPSSSPSPFPFSGAFAGRWCHKSFVRSHLGLQAAMVLTAHGADDFQKGGSKGGTAIFWHMKTSVGVGAEIEREIAHAICHLLLRAFFFHWVHVMHASERGSLLGVNCCHRSVMCALMGTAVYLYL